MQRATRTLLPHTHTRTQKPAPKRNARQNAGASSRFSLNLPVGREERARSHDVWPERRGWLSNPALLPCGSWCVEVNSQNGGRALLRNVTSAWRSKHWPIPGRVHVHVNRSGSGVCVGHHGGRRGECGDKYQQQSSNEWKL